MKDFLRRHPLVLPILMLLLASLLGGVLLAARIALSRRWDHLYLPWNLFLAWVPLVLAMVVRQLEARAARADAPPPTRRRSARWAAGLAVPWLLFLPNAPYLLTDLVHLPDPDRRTYFADMMLILHFALVGLMAGFLSLHLLHGVVERRWGWLKGWAFVGVVSALTGVGVYLGRVLRKNSWDVLLHPWDLALDVMWWGLRVVERPSELVLPALFGSTMLLAYTLFSSLLRPSLAVNTTSGGRVGPAEPAEPRGAGLRGAWP